MYNKYKIILVSFPFTNLSGDKIRPAVIISDKIIGDDIVVAFISSSVKKLFTFDIKIKKTDKNGLKKNSVIKTSKIATIDKKVVLGEIGETESILRRKIDNNLKKVLGL